MINRKDNPVEWALLMYELTDAREHLSDLIDGMGESEDDDETGYAVLLGHVYSHLNRAWNNRNAKAGLESRWLEHSSYPDDLQPL